MTCTQASSAKFASLLAHHQAQAGLEGTPDVILTHVLADLIEYCDAHKLDLHAELDSAREMLAEAGQ